MWHKFWLRKKEKKKHILSVELTLSCSSTLKNAVFSINVAVKRAFICKQEQQQQQHFLLGGYKLKHYDFYLFKLSKIIWSVIILP